MNIKTVVSKLIYKINFYYLNNTEIFGSILLFFSICVAIILSNSPYQNFYNILINTKIKIILYKNCILDKTILLWINDGLMTIYFLFIGIEIRQEIIFGIFSNKSRIKIPIISACGGFICPAIIFILFNFYNSEYLRGWAIPTSTDIAFTLGILSLFKSNIPHYLRIILTSITIFDDILAIFIIAIFYTNDLSYIFIMFSCICIIILIILNMIKFKYLFLFFIFGILLWIFILQSGIHSTLSGIIFAFLIPNYKEYSILNKIKYFLHPWITLFILPMFAFFNSGINFSDVHIYMFKNSIVLGIIFGLFFGKQIGILCPIIYFVKVKNFFKMDTIKIDIIYRTFILCSIGFTMSLLISSIAYKENKQLILLSKFGIIFTSLCVIIQSFLCLIYTYFKSKKY